jgi:hypothetical protein
MERSVKPPNNQLDSVTAPAQPNSVKPPNTQLRPDLSSAVEVASVKPPNNS